MNSPVVSMSQGIANLINEMDVITRLDRIERKLDLLASKPAEKDFYSTAEVAAAAKKTEYTVREWCREGRVRAEKRPCGRGATREWMISRNELSRLLNEGLLP
jgi:hypothetical protein